jgi:hypothetical protein
MGEAWINAWITRSRDSIEDVLLCKPGELGTRSIRRYAVSCADKKDCHIWVGFIGPRQCSEWVAAC